MTAEEISAEEAKEKEARRERRRLEAEAAAKASPAAKSKRATGEKPEKRLRSAKYPVVLERWLRLSDDFAAPEVLEAMCEVAGIPHDVIEDRLPAIRKTWGGKQAKKARDGK